MTRFLLDTDTVSFAMRDVGAVGARLRAHAPSQVAISVITLAELRYGAARKRSAVLARSIEAFLAPITILPFSAEAARRYAQLVADLEHQGAPLDDFDALIAAHALVEQRTLVTHNRRHFARVGHLSLDDWC